MPSQRFACMSVHTKCDDVTEAIIHISTLPQDKNRSITFSGHVSCSFSKRIVRQSFHASNKDETNTFVPFLHRRVTPVRRCSSFACELDSSLEIRRRPRVPIFYLSKKPKENPSSKALIRFSSFAISSLKALLINHPKKRRYGCSNLSLRPLGRRAGHPH